MSLQNTKIALMTKLDSVLGGIPAEKENAHFIKPPDAKWAQVFFMPTQPTVFTLGAGGLDEYRGLVQVSIRYPEGTGTKDADDDCETFRSQFKAGTMLVYGGQEVKIISCGRNQGRLQDNWFLVAITISWYALVPR